MNTLNQYETYDKDHCWQYDIKLQTIDEYKTIGLSDDELKTIRTNDFEFEFIDKSDKEQNLEIKKFIEKYEWLGKLPTWLTHRFIARYKGILGGVVIMATPNAFSDMLGIENRNMEKLIARGASASWCPKNMASWQIMKSIDWMVKNTEYRLFTAYSDPIARELGTVYQACNFYYLGSGHGGTYVYFDESNPNLGWVGSHYFHYRSAYVRYAKELGIKWMDDWYTPKKKVNWRNIPEDIKKSLKYRAKEKIASCKKMEVPSKHKYAYVLGKNKAETKLLRQKFLDLNEIFPYPKERGK